MPKRANMNGTAGGALVQVARVYLRVSTDEQDLQRQEAIITAARAAGYYVAGVYREKASGARADRPELLRMVADLQLGEGVGAEKIDRISRLPLTEAERQGMERARSAGKYKGRRADPNLRQLVIELRGDGLSIATTAKRARCSAAQVKRI